jgi:tRNA (cmo5U34)-methyltransferase
MSEYRWNLSDYAAGYDAAADVIHPHYLEIQDAILAAIPFPPDAEILLVDLGGGSGRLAARFLERWPRAQAIVIDQSEPFLALAERRLAAFDGRGTCLLARLQDDWRSKLPRPASAIVSMSAIHHLEPVEKQAVYQQACEALAARGIFLNGDEVRPERDDNYRREVDAWADHMRGHMADGSIGVAFHPALDKWIERNVTQFGQPRKSGDDCHETAAAQLTYLEAAGFAEVDCRWQKRLWGILRGRKQ